MRFDFSQFQKTNYFFGSIAILEFETTAKSIHSIWIAFVQVTFFATGIELIYAEVNWFLFCGRRDESNKTLISFTSLMTIPFNVDILDDPIRFFMVDWLSNHHFHITPMSNARVLYDKLKLLKIIISNYRFSCWPTINLQGQLHEVLPTSHL